MIKTFICYLCYSATSNLSCESCEKAICWAHHTTLWVIRDNQECAHSLCTECADPEEGPQ